MGRKYSRFHVPSKREKWLPRVETAAAKRQTRKMSDHVTISAVRGEKNTRCLISLMTEWEGRTGKYLARGQGVRTERSGRSSCFWPTMNSLMPSKKRRFALRLFAYFTVFPVKPWTPENISGMFIVPRPIRCEMKPQKLTAKPQNELITTWHETTHSLFLPRGIFNFAVFKCWNFSLSISALLSARNRYERHFTEKRS